MAQRLEKSSPIQLWDVQQSTNLNNVIVTDPKPLSSTRNRVKTEDDDSSSVDTALCRWETKHTSVEVTSSLPKPTLLPFTENNAITPKTTQSFRKANDKTRTGTDSKNTTIHFTIPKTEKNSQSDRDSLHCDDGYHRTANNVEETVASTKSYKVSKSILRKMVDRVDPISVTTEQPMISEAKQSTQPMLKEQHTSSFNGNMKDAEIQQPTSVDVGEKSQKVIVHLPSHLLDDVAKPKGNVSAEIEKTSIQDLPESKQQRAQVSRKRASSPNSMSVQQQLSPPFDYTSTDLNKNHDTIQSGAVVAEGQRSPVTDYPKRVGQERSRPASSPRLISRMSTGLNMNQSSPVKSNAPVKGQPSSVDNEAIRIDRNRKIFETWLTKKRKAAEKRKEENKHKIQSISRQISSGLTFEEWLKTKKDEETDENKSMSHFKIIIIFVVYKPHCPVGSSLYISEIELKLSTGTGGPAPLGHTVTVAPPFEILRMKSQLKTNVCPVGDH